MALVAASLLLVLPTPLAAAPTAPLLHGGTCQGPCWASYVVRTNGAKAEFEVTAKTLRLPVQLGGLVYEASSSSAPVKLVFSFTYLVMDADNGVFVSVDGRPGINVDTRAPQRTMNSLGITLTMNGAKQDYLGRYKVLLWGTGSVGETEYELHGDPGTRYLGHDVGFRTFMYTSADFRGLLNAQVGTGASEARVNKGVRKVLDIKDTMIGIFGPAGGTPGLIDELTVEGPSGVRECPCFFSNFGPAAQGLPPATAGRYTFQIDGGDPQLGNSAEILLAGVDARLAPQTIAD